VALQDDDEAEIRKHYRDIRDRLKGASARLDTLSKAIVRPEMGALFGNQSDLFDWLAKIFDELEQLRLNIISSNSRNEQTIDALEKIRAWQKMYEPSLDAIKRDHDKLKDVLKGEDNNGNEKKGNH
jgi:hypothetical protein